MSKYEHGIEVVESSTALTVPLTGNSGLQVVVGTAPVHLTGNVTGKVNTPILCNDFAEAVSNLGYSENFEKYTLCQSMYASFQVFSIAPVIFINVLDPKKHKKENTETTYVVTGSQALVNLEGVLLDSLVVSHNSTELLQGVDYVAEFNSEGHVVISIVEGGAATGAESLTVKSNSLDPDAVTVAVQVNGKLRATVHVPMNSDKETVLAAAMAEERVFSAVEGKTVVKEILVPNKILNLVVR